MARPKKEGFEYFPLDVDIFSDRKIKRIRCVYGGEGVAVYIFVLCEIYRKGYYIELCEDLIEDISIELGIACDKVDEMIKLMLKRELFAQVKSGDVTALTSRGVQKRYQEIIRQSRRKVPERLDFWLLSEEETHLTPSAGDEFPRDNAELTQDLCGENAAKESKLKESKLKESKVKETKVKEIKGNESKSEETKSAAKPSAEPCQSTDSHFPDGPIKSYGTNRRIHLTDGQYKRLKNDYGEDMLKKYIERMDSWMHAKRRLPFHDYEEELRKWFASDNIYPAADDDIDKYYCVVNKFDIP